MGKKMIQIILIVIGAVFVIWFLIPGFTSGSFNIGSVTGAAVFAAVLLYGIFFGHVNRFIAWFWHLSYGKAVEIIVGLCLAAVLALACASMVCMLSASGKTAADGLNVIVLGCRVKGDRPSLMLEERLEKAYEYLEKNPDSMCVVSGGKGEGELISEAQMMYTWLTDKGIDSGRIICEDTSTDTHENLKNTEEIISLKKMLDSQCPSVWDRDVAIVTNEFHEYRALKIAKEVGLNASPVPAGTAWWLYPTYCVREMYGILEDWFLK